ncbi:MAG: hypothetical protein AAGB93_00495 [Planctomycetota bacterium]
MGLLVSPILYLGCRRTVTYSESYSPPRSEGDHKYEQKIDGTLVYLKVVESRKRDEERSNVWTDHWILGEPYSLLISSLNYNGATDPLVVTSVWITVGSQQEVLVDFPYPLELTYKRTDPNVAFTSASTLAPIDDLLRFSPEQTVTFRMNYIQPGRVEPLSIRTRFEPRSSTSSITDLETLLLGG